MTTTTRTVLVAAVLMVGAFAGVALGTPATTTTTTDEQTNETAAIEFPDQRIDGESVTIDAATLPDGGFAVVYDQGGTPIGHTDYLSAGDHSNLTVSLNESVERPQVLIVTLYRNNASESYNASEDSVAYETESGADVSDVAYVYFEERSRSTSDETSTTAAETTASSDDTTDAPMADETTSDETTQESSGGIPGFTPITAVVALLAATFVALRRN